ncbi:MAG TPA: ATP-binding protein [Firmicutes bacterium]|nr:ATP-binding protein [Bacillota bacterium]
MLWKGQRGRLAGPGGCLERKESVIISGAVGVGKSHICQALGHIACQRGYSVIYRKAPKPFADLGGATLMAPSRSACVYISSQIYSSSTTLGCAISPHCRPRTFMSSSASATAAAR